MKYLTIGTSAALLGIAPPVFADDSELARKLSNPVADLISVPVRNNVDFGIGPGDDTQWSTNVQPGIPNPADDLPGGGKRGLRSGPILLFLKS